MRLSIRCSPQEAGFKLGTGADEAYVCGRSHRLPSHDDCGHLDRQGAVVSADSPHTSAPPPTLSVIRPRLSPSRHIASWISSTAPDTERSGGAAFIARSARVLNSCICDWADWSKTPPSTVGECRTRFRFR